MIKTEKLVKHTICCPHCRGSLRLKNDSRNEFDALFNSTNHGVITCRVKTRRDVPTCINCGKKFEVKFDTKEFSIELKDI